MSWSNRRQAQHFHRGALREASDLGIPSSWASKTHLGKAVQNLTRKNREFLNPLEMDCWSAYCHGLDQVKEWIPQSVKEFLRFGASLGHFLRLQVLLTDHPTANLKSRGPVRCCTLSLKCHFTHKCDPSGSWVRSKCSQSAQSFQSLMTSDPRCLRHSGMGFRINLYREPGWDSWSYMSSLSNTWTIRNANTNKISFKQDESTNLFIGMQRCTPILSHRAYEYLWITTTRMLPQFHIPSCPRWLLMVSKIRCSLSNLRMVDSHSASSPCFNHCEVYIQYKKYISIN